MPKLLIFAICEKAMADKATGQLSLVGITGSFAIPKEELQGLSPNDVQIPVNWYAAGIFARESGDEQHQWEAMLEIVQPDGVIVAALEQGLDLQDDRNVFYMYANGFPVGYIGTYELRLSVRIATEGNNAPWRQKGEWQVAVEHQE